MLKRSQNKLRHSCKHVSYLDPDGFHGFIFKAATAGRVKCITSFSGLFYPWFYNGGGGGCFLVFSAHRKTLIKLKPMSDNLPQRKTARCQKVTEFGVFTPGLFFFFRFVFFKKLDRSKLVRISPPQVLLCSHCIVTKRARGTRFAFTPLCHGPSCVPVVFCTVGRRHDNHDDNKTGCG